MCEFSFVRFYFFFFEYVDKSRILIEINEKFSKYIYNSIFDLFFARITLCGRIFVEPFAFSGGIVNVFVFLGLRHE